MKVLKKSGDLEDFSVEKIKQAISFACENLEVNPLALESLFNQSLFDGMSTVSIQENLIHHAKTLCSPQESDWVYVAGRLETMNLWSRTGAYKISFKDFVKIQLEDGIWQHPGFAKYSDAELEELGAQIEKDRDLRHSYASIITAQQKYLMKNECPQQMFMGNAMVIASIENEDNRMIVCKRAYEYLSVREISSGTPWLGNLRANGNISSCFIIQPEDTLISIYDNLKNAAMISQSGGGLGVSLARCRALGSDLMGVKGIAGGILGWNKLFNDTAVSVNQCFSGDTQVYVATADTQNPVGYSYSTERIDNLNVGDLVLTHDGTYKFVEHVYTANAEDLDMFEITTEQGTVTVSGSHPVMIKTGNVVRWSSIYELREGDEIVSVLPV